MSSVGYYRYKTSVGSEVRDIQFFVNGELAGTKTIQPVEYCVGGKILKYLDTKGQYRFFPFTKYYEVNDNPRQIGTTNKFVTNLLTDQTNKQSIGSENTRSIDLTGEVSSEELEILQSIYASPRVYLYIGDGSSDQPQDWLEVEITGGDRVVRRRRANHGAINLTIKLPEHYSVRMI